MRLYVKSDDGFCLLGKSVGCEPSGSRSCQRPAGGQATRWDDTRGRPRGPAPARRPQVLRRTLKPTADTAVKCHNPRPRDRPGEARGEPSTGVRDRSRMMPGRRRERHPAFWGAHLRPHFLPGADRWQRGAGEARGFGCGDAEQAQEGFGKLVYRALLDVARVALVQPQQPKQPPGDGGQGDFRVGKVKRPVAWPALISRKARGASPRGAFSRSRPALVMNWAHLPRLRHGVSRRAVVVPLR